MLLLLSLACAAPDTSSDAKDAANPDDSAAGDTADTNDSDDTGDSGDTDTAADVDADADGSPGSTDCDDANPAIHPGATETCDGTDENCNGSVDEGNGSIALLVEGPGNGTVTTGTWYGYDADDNAVLIGSDFELDGVLDNFSRTEWENGLMVATERSNDGATLVERIEYDRNADGAITEGRIDQNGDGVWDYAYGYIYTDGVYTGFWYDYDYDGDYETSYGYEYNSYGLQTHYYEDADGDGVYDREVNYVYDADHMISGEADNDGDGIFETLYTYTWQGDRLVEELVTGGTYPYRRTYEFTDADDYWDSSDYDVSDDGSVDYRYTQTVNADGLLLTQSSDSGADGVDVYSALYELDSEGRNVRNSSYMDGVLTGVWEYDYYEAYSVAAMRTDSNGDGRWEYSYTYDTFAHLTSQLADSNSDGAIDSLQEWSYDERGRRLGTSIDYLGDGTLEFEQWPLDGYACGSK